MQTHNPNAPTVVSVPFRDLLVEVRALDGTPVTSGDHMHRNGVMLTVVLPLGRLNADRYGWAFNPEPGARVAAPRYRRDTPCSPLTNLQAALVAMGR